MNTTPDFDQLLRTHFGQRADLTVIDRQLDGVLDRTANSRQRPGWLAALRSNSTTTRSNRRRGGRSARGVGRRPGRPHARAGPRRRHRGWSASRRPTGQWPAALRRPDTRRRQGLVHRGSRRLTPGPASAGRPRQRTMVAGRQDHPPGRFDDERGHDGNLHRLDRQRGRQRPPSASAHRVLRSAEPGLLGLVTGCDPSPVRGLGLDRSFEERPLHDQQQRRGRSHPGHNATRQPRHAREFRCRPGRRPGPPRNVFARRDDDRLRRRHCAADQWGAGLRRAGKWPDDRQHGWDGSAAGRNAAGHRRPSGVVTGRSLDSRHQPIPALQRRRCHGVRDPSRDQGPAGRPSRRSDMVAGRHPDRVQEIRWWGGDLHHAPRRHRTRPGVPLGLHWRRRCHSTAGTNGCTAARATPRSRCRARPAGCGRFSPLSAWCSGRFSAS